MKKLIMTAIVICLSIATAIPFSSVKASTQSVSSNNFTPTWGSISSNLITDTSAAATIDLSIYGITTDYYTEACVVSVNFNDYYSGRIRLYFNSTDFRPAPLKYVIGNAAIHMTGYNGNVGRYFVELDFSNCTEFTYIMASKTTGYITGNVFDYEVSNMTAGLNVNINTNESFNYQIPWYQISAYAFATQNVDDVQYHSGDIYPYMSITSGTRSKTASIVSAGGPKHFIFITDTNLQSGAITSSNNNVAITYVVVSSYTFGGGYRMYDLSFALTSGTSQNVYLNYNQNFNIIPVFYGTYSQMPDDVYAIINNSHVYENTLQRILQLLMNQGDGSQTSDDINSISDELNDYDSQISDIISGTSDNIDDFIDAVDLDTYDFLTGIANASEYFKIQLENVFNVSSYIRAFWVIPVICIVLMRLLGG